MWYMCVICGAQIVLNCVCFVNSYCVSIIMFVIVCDIHLLSRVCVYIYCINISCVCCELCSGIFWVVCVLYVYMCAVWCVYWWLNGSCNLCCILCVCRTNGVVTFMCCLHVYIYSYWYVYSVVYIVCDFGSLHICIVRVCDCVCVSRGTMCIDMYIVCLCVCAVNVLCKLLCNWFMQFGLCGLMICLWSE